MQQSEFSFLSLPPCSSVERLKVWHKIEIKSAAHQVCSKKKVHSIYFTLLSMNMQLGTYQGIWGSGYLRIICLCVPFKNQSRTVLHHEPEGQAQALSLAIYQLFPLLKCDRQTPMTDLCACLRVLAHNSGQEY